MKYKKKLQEPLHSKKKKKKRSCENTPLHNCRTHPRRSSFSSSFLCSLELMVALQAFFFSFFFLPGVALALKHQLNKFSRF